MGHKIVRFKFQRRYVVHFLTLNESVTEVRPFFLWTYPPGRLSSRDENKDQFCFFLLPDFTSPPSCSVTSVTSSANSLGPLTFFFLCNLLLHILFLFCIFPSGKELGWKLEWITSSAAWSTAITAQITAMQHDLVVNLLPFFHTQDYKLFPLLPQEISTTN